MLTTVLRPNNFEILSSFLRCVWLKTRQSDTQVRTVIKLIYWVRVMVFNATFNNISVILWRSVLLVEETGVPGENNRPAASH